jgi:hypothetical protein
VTSALKIKQVGDTVHIEADEGVEINGGGSYSHFRDGVVEEGTAGEYVVHSNGTGTDGAQSLAVTPQVFPNSINESSNKKPEIRVVPNIQLPWLSIFSYIEKIDGSKFSNSDTVFIGGKEITEKWVGPNGKIYFIPQVGGLTSENVVLNGQTLIAESEIRPHKDEKELIDSLVMQMDILNEVGLLIFNDQNESNKVDVVMIQGNFRYIMLLDEIENINMSLEMQKYFLEKRLLIKNLI